MKRTLVSISCLVVLFVAYTAAPGIAQETSGSFADGSIQVGYDNRPCGSSLQGSLRYNSAGPSVEFCQIPQGVTPIDPPVVKDDYFHGDFWAGVSLDVHGDYAYAASYDGGSRKSLRVVDISNPSSLSLAGTFTDSGNTVFGGSNIATDGSYVYVTKFDADRVSIIDVTNKSSPTVSGMGSVTDATKLNGAVDIAVSGDFAYVAAQNYDGLTIIDVSDKSSPTIRGDVTSGTFLNGPVSIAVNGTYAYVYSKSGTRYLSVIDISDPDNPTRLDSFNHSSFSGLNFDIDVSDDGTFVYIPTAASNRLTIVDATDKNSLSLAGTVQDNTKLEQSQSVAVLGDTAYVSGYQGSGTNYITVVDVSDPTTPVVGTSVTDNKIGRIFYHSGENVVSLVPGDGGTGSDQRVTAIQIGNAAGSPGWTAWGE